VSSKTADLEAMSKQELADEFRALLDREKDRQVCRSEGERLVHELQVHQIELETQNRHLRDTQVELERAQARHASLYDFTPVPYFTFDAEGRHQGGQPRRRGAART
jgi:hypothetical protein